MDGNGRWAKARGLSRSHGHEAGTKAAKALVTHCRELGVGHLTLYTFSRENWSRPKEEVGYLFKLLADFLTRELKSLMEQDVRLNILGAWQELPFATRQVLGHVLKKTADNRSMVLNLALNYSGREEIVAAARSLAAEGAPPEDITEEALAARLTTAGQPDPDLVIRTSGEHRVSNFLLFQSAYSEFHFTETLWPDFGREELMAALEDFGARQRRFGGTGEDDGAPDKTRDAAPAMASSGEEA